LVGDPFQNTRIDERPFTEHRTAQSTCPGRENCPFMTFRGCLAENGWGMVHPRRRRSCARFSGSRGNAEGARRVISRSATRILCSRSRGTWAGAHSSGAAPATETRKGGTHSFDVIPYKHPLAIARFLIHNSPTRSLDKREPHQESPACPEGEGVCGAQRKTRITTGNIRYARPEDTLWRAVARIQHCVSNPATFERCPSRRGGIALSGATPDGKTRLDRIGLGIFGE